MVDFTTDPKNHIRQVNIEQQNAEKPASSRVGIWNKLKSFAQVMWIRATTWNDQKLQDKAFNVFHDTNGNGSYAITWFSRSQIKKFDFLNELSIFWES